jgi:hypothetical protein
VDPFLVDKKHTLYGFLGTFLTGFRGDFSKRWLSLESGLLEKIVEVEGSPYLVGVL